MITISFNPILSDVGWFDDIDGKTLFSSSSFKTGCDKGNSTSFSSLHSVPCGSLSASLQSSLNSPLVPCRASSISFSSVKGSPKRSVGWRLRRGRELIGNGASVCFFTFFFVAILVWRFHAWSFSACSCCAVINPNSRKRSLFLSIFLARSFSYLLIFSLMLPLLVDNDELVLELDDDDELVLELDDDDDDIDLVSRLTSIASKLLPSASSMMPSSTGNSIALFSSSSLDDFHQSNKVFACSFTGWNRIASSVVVLWNASNTSVHLSSASSTPDWPRISPQSISDGSQAPDLEIAESTSLCGSLCWWCPATSGVLSTSWAAKSWFPSSSLSYPLLLHPRRSGGVGAWGVTLWGLYCSWWK